MSRYEFDCWVEAPTTIWHEAECLDCDWKRADDSTPYVMIDAKMHVRRFGHNVRKTASSTYSLSPMSEESIKAAGGEL